MRLNSGCPRRVLGQLAVLSFDVAFLLATSACLWLAASIPAQAYVDPSVMTYTIQALAGVAVALSAVIGVAWRRLRRVVLKMLKVDENAGKTVETTVSAIDPAKFPDAATSAPATLREPTTGAFDGTPLTWPKRFGVLFASCAALCFAVLFASPLVVVVTGSSSLSFSFSDVWAPLLLCTLVCAVILSAVLSAFRGKAFELVLALVVGVCVASMVQELALNGFLPAATGEYVNWFLYKKAICASILIWGAIIAACILFARKRAVFMRLACPAICLVIALAQGVNLGIVVANAPATSSSDLVVTEEGLTTVSSKSNVIVFVLDMFDTQFMDDVVEQFPDSTSELTGFTWYHNATGSMIPTRYGIPYIVTGKSFDTSSSSFTTDQLASWFSEDNLLDEAAEQGYSVGVYSDSVGYGLESLKDKTMNVHAIEPGSRNIDFLSCAKSLFGVGLYRDLPSILKPFFWFTTDSVNAAMCPANSSDAASTPYLINDARMHASFEDSVLEASDESAGGAYRVIHLQGSHWPYTLNENGESEQLEQVYENQVRQSAGSLSIVSEYIRQLKELGVYDCSTIVITADHGQWQYGSHSIPGASNPFLLVKPAGADSSANLQVSEVATGHVDLPGTLEWAIGKTPSNPTVFDATDGDRKRYFLYTNHDGHTDYELVEYEIDGDANDFSSWHETGRSWKVDMEGYE